MDGRDYLFQKMNNCPLRFTETDRLRLRSHLTVFEHDLHSSGRNGAHCSHQHSTAFLRCGQFDGAGGRLMVYDDQDQVTIYSLSHDMISHNSYYDMSNYYSTSQNQFDPQVMDVEDGEISDSINVSVTAPSSVLESPNERVDDLIKSSEFNAGETIYDCKWFSSTSMMAIATRDHPIHLWDVESKSIVCSYRGHNQYDELDNTFSLAFNPTADKLYTGSCRLIRIFDISNPGKNYTEIPLCKSKKDYFGQKGIVSSISFNPDQSKAYAVGTYAGNLGIYVEDESGIALDIQGLCIGGITHIKWSPCGNYLWAGGRNNKTITCWDIRKTQSEIGNIERNLTTNQKMIFDMDPWGKYLSTGTQDGEILIYDTSSFELVARKSNVIDGSSNMDCVNSSIFHPYSAILCTVTGQRHHIVDDCDSEEEEDGKREISSKDRITSAIQLWEIDKETINYSSASGVE